MAGELKAEECKFSPATINVIESNEDPLLGTLRAIVPHPVEGNRVKQMTDFISKNLMDVDKTTAKAFIENELFMHFQIKERAPNRAIVKEYFRDEYKLRNSQKQQKEAVEKVEKAACIPDSCLIDKEFNGLYELEINEKTGNVRVIAFLDKIAERVVKNTYAIAYKDNVYCYKDGKFINSEQTVEAEALRILGGIYKKERSAGAKKNLADVMKYVTLGSITTEYPFNQTTMALNVKNGVIVFNEDGFYSIEEHNPEKYQFNYMLPVTYDECIDSEYIMSELTKYTEKPEALIQVLAQVIIQAIGYNPQKIAYLMYGPSDYGKSSLLQIYKYFVKTLFSKVPLSRMSTETDNRFVYAPMEGMLMNIADELSYFKMSDTNGFKDITGSYDIWVEPKGVDAYAARTTAVQLFTTNKTPSFDGRVKDDAAFWKRITLIPITKTKFSISDDFEKKVLTDENMSGLLNVTLSMVSGFITGTPLKYHSHNGDDWERTREEWMQAGNPLYKFMCDNMVKGGRTAIIKADLLKVVQKWCDEGNILNKKSRPENVMELADVVKMCNGKLDDRRNFYKMSPIEMETRTAELQKEYDAELAKAEAMVTGKWVTVAPDVKKKIDTRMTETEEKYCYILPWSWKEEKDEKGEIIKNKYAVQCREAFRKETEEEE